MNKKLHNRTIYVGRSDSGSKLMIAVTDGNALKVAAIGAVGSVPGSVSRWKPNEKKAHCKITIDANGSMVVTNMVDANITRVNGVSIVEKAIKSDDTIMLGRDEFVLDINKTLEIADKLVGAGAPDSGKEYDTTPMAAIWDEYHSKTLMMRISQRKINNIRLMVMLISALGSAVSALTGYSIALVVTIPILIWCTYKSFVDKTIEKQDELTERMQTEYVYPCCGHFAGLQAYKVIKQNKNCPYCKAKLKHKED